MPPSTVRRITARYSELKRESQMWWPLYQLIGEYVRTRKQHFTTDGTPGEFLNEQLFDSTASRDNHLMGSSMIGALWPNGSKSVKLEAPRIIKRAQIETDEVKEWYEFATETLVDVMDQPEAGLLTALEEYMTDEGAFGLAGIGAFEKEDDEVPFTFRAIDAKVASIDENADGVVDTIYMEKKMTVRQVVEQYGLENVSKGTRDHYNEGKLGEKIKVLHVIEPRLARNLNSFSAKDMPIASIHIELDKEKILKESGFTEMPVFITRFWKAMNEKRGRSPGMDALPDILELNAIREAVPIAIEKNLDPPLAVFDDGALGGGTINTSAGALNVFSVSGRVGANQRPVEQLITVGELQSSYARISELTESIGQHFFKDRLMDFNNETRMTLGEAHLRNGLREQSLGTIYARQLKELFVPLIQRVFNGLLRRGYFGVIRGSRDEQEILAQGGQPRYIPDAVANLMLLGKEVYRIKFINPAARIMQSEELLGLQRMTEFAVGVAPVNGEIIDNINFDKLIRRVQDLTGASDEIMNSIETVKNIREARAEQQKQMAELEMNKAGSEVARNMAQAQQMAAEGQQNAA